MVSLHLSTVCQMGVLIQSDQERVLAPVNSVSNGCPHPVSSGACPCTCQQCVKWVSLSSLIRSVALHLSTVCQMGVLIQSDQERVLRTCQQCVKWVSLSSLIRDALAFFFQLSLSTLCGGQWCGMSWIYFCSCISDRQDLLIKKWSTRVHFPCLKCDIVRDRSMQSYGSYQTETKHSCKKTTDYFIDIFRSLQPLKLPREIISTV